jgi:hypothetical protein
MKQFMNIFLFLRLGSRADAPGTHRGHPGWMNQAPAVKVGKGKGMACRKAGMPRTQPIRRSITSE